jgi:hypothetical protein
MRSELTAYLLSKGLNSLLKAVTECTLNYWKASTLMPVNKQLAQQIYKQKALEIEADVIVHGLAEFIGGGGGTVEQAVQTVSPEVKPIAQQIITPPPTAPPPPEVAVSAKAGMEGLMAIPRAVIPMPENVKILFEKPMASLAESLRTAPEHVREITRINLVENMNRMADASAEMLKMASRIATAVILKTPVTVEGLTVTPETAPQALRNAYTTGIQTLQNLIEALRILTEANPLTPQEEIQIVNALTQTTANLTRIREIAGLPPTRIPPATIRTIYGYEYVCPNCGSVYYTPAEIEAHVRATGHGIA